MEKRSQFTSRNDLYDFCRVNLKPLVQQKLMGLPEGLAWECEWRHKYIPKRNKSHLWI